MDKNKKNKRFADKKFELNRFINLAQDILVVTSFDGCIEWINPAWEKVLGYKTEVILGQNIYNLIHRDDIADYKSNISSLLGGKNEINKTRGIEFRIKTDKREYKWLMWNISANMKQGLLYTAGREITSRKYAEQEGQLLHRLSDYYNRQIPFHDALHYTLAEVNKFLGWSYSQIWLIDLNTKEICRGVSSLSLNGRAPVSESPLKQKAKAGNDSLRQFDQLNKLYNIIPNCDLVYSVLKGKEPIWIERIQDQNKFLRLPWAKNAGLKSMLIVPAIFKGEVVAIIEFFSKKSFKADPIILKTIGSVSVQLGLYVARKGMEESLRKSEKLLSDTQKITHVASWEWNVSNDNVLWSAELNSITGMDLSQRHGSYRNLMNILPAEEVWKFRENLRKVVDNQHPIRFEQKIILPDGTEKRLDVMIEVLTDDDGKVEKVLGTVRDITAQKAIEAALQRNEEYFRSLIENSLDITSILADNGEFKYISPSVGKILGYTQNAVIGKSVLDYVHPEDIKNVQRVFLLLKSVPGRIKSVEFRIRTNEGEYLILENIMRNLLDNSAVSGIVINSRDVTTRRNTELQLEKSREQMRLLSAHLQSAREEERTRISREIHDELGQALTGLKMDLSWVGKKIGPELIGNNGIREKFLSMDSLIDSTIKVVRKISTELRPGVLDYLGIYAAIEWQAQEFQKRTGIDCKIHSLIKDLELEQDLATAIFRIFQETLTNITRHANATNVDVSLQENKDVIELVILDNGRGIADEDLNNTKSLGILGMRERAELLGGNLKIGARPDGGTYVILQIPIAINNLQGKNL